VTEDLALKNVACPINRKEFEVTDAGLRTEDVTKFADISRAILRPMRARFATDFC
jgi:hypothetical protein